MCSIRRAANRLQLAGEHSGAMRSYRRQVLPQELVEIKTELKGVAIGLACYWITLAKSFFSFSDLGY